MTRATEHTRGGSYGYRPELDGVRAIAVLAIMLVHSASALGNPRLVGGFLSVDLFFVLSGFLITTLLLRERDRAGQVRLASFYGRRALRLLPALVVTLVIAALVVLVIGSNVRGRPYPAAAAITLSYAANWFQAERDLGILGHTWTLSIEEQYYLLWPVGLLSALRAGLTRERLAVSAVVVAILVAVSRALTYRHIGDSEAFVWTINRADGVLLGSALALVLASRNRAAVERVLRSGWIAGAAVIAVLGLAARLGLRSPMSYYGGIFAANLFFVVIVGHMAVRRSGMLAALFRIPPLPAIGVISYGLYLYHYPMHYLVHLRSDRWTGVGSVIVMFAATFALAIVSFVFVERPALRWKARLRPEDRGAAGQAAAERSPSPRGHT